MAFKLAAILAFKEAMPNAAPTLLEPIGSLAVTVPESYVGDVMGDLSKRRGRPMGMNPDADGNTVIEAEVPMAEMGSYAIDLRAMTQARGSFTLKFERYEEVPKANQAKIIEEAKANEE
jgi:elongation factor G